MTSARRSGPPTCARPSGHAETVVTLAAMPTWGALLEDYDIAMRAAGRSAGTIRLHRYRILDVAGLVDRPESVTTGDLLPLLARTDLAPETRKSIRTSLRSFFRWAHGTNRLPHDPSEALPSVRVPSAEPRPVPDQVVIDAMREASPRVRVMLLLAAYAGLRACEIARVHAEDFDGRMLTVLGKGQRRRRVPIVQAELRWQLQDLARAGGWAFPNGRGTHLSPGHVTRLVSAALPGTWTAHPCRHRFGTAAHAGTRDLLAVQRLLGHSRPETTQRYVLLGEDSLWAAAESAA